MSFYLIRSYLLKKKSHGLHNVNVQNVSHWKNIFSIKIHQLFYLSFAYILLLHRLKSKKNFFKQPRLSLTSIFTTSGVPLASCITRLLSGAISLQGKGCCSVSPRSCLRKPYYPSLCLFELAFILPIFLKDIFSDVSSGEWLFDFFHFFPFSALEDFFHCLLAHMISDSYFLSVFFSISF